MADLKVSQLPIVTAAGSNDKIIVNTGTPQETKTITVGNLLSQASGFAPIHIKLDGEYNSPEITRTIGTVGGAINDGSDTYSNVLSGATPATVTMPAGADSAVIIYETTVRLLSRVGNPSDTNSHCTYQVRIVIDGATTSNQVVTNRISMSGGTSFPHPPTNSGSSTTDYIGKFQSVVRPTKSAILNFIEASVVTFTPQCRLIKAKQGYFQVESGRVMLFPYNSANLVASAIANTFAASDDDADLPPITQAEIEADSSKELKNRMLFLINAIDETLRYDADFDTQFPSNSTDTGVGTGTGVNGNYTPRELLQATAEAVMAIKRNPTLTDEQMDVQLDSLENQAAPYVAFKFNWQVNSFASFF